MSYPREFFSLSLSLCSRRPIRLVLGRRIAALAKIGGVLLILVFLAGMPAKGWADFLDPATLQIGGSLPPPGNDPNLIGNSGLVNIFQNQGSTPELDTPFLLIIGVANDTTGGHFFGTTDPITSVTAKNPYTSGTSEPGSSQLGGTNVYGGTWNTTTGFAGTMSSGGEAYSTLGKLQGPYDKSNNFVNWSGADSTDDGITATKFGIYVFEITAPLAAKGVVSVQFASGALPEGSYAIAYGWAPQGKDTQIYDTPFTQSGLTSSGGGAVPAPPSIVLLAVGGLCVSGFWFVSRRRMAAAV